MLESSVSSRRFSVALNPATIRGYNLPIEEQIRLIAEAGFEATEPWQADVANYVERGGRLSELKKRFEDANLKVCGLMSFATWAQDDPDIRAKGLEDVRRDMDTVLQIGGDSIAVPPMGFQRAPSAPPVDVFVERYANVCKIAESLGAYGTLEVWGHSAIFSKLSEAMYVAAAVGSPRAALLLDAYHLYKGDGLKAYESLKLVAGNRMRNFHLNDFPAKPLPELVDGDRVLPGEGIAPLDYIQDILFENGYRGFMSLEIFNKEYWAAYPDPAEFLKLCAAKTFSVVK